MQHLPSLRSSLEQILHKNILAYWLEHAIDTEQGGFYGQIDANDQVVKDAPKGVILTTRILWSFSAAYQVANDIRYKEAADRAFRYMADYFRDKEYKGVYWMLDASGQPLNKRKQIYAQAFALYALSEYFKISRSLEAYEWCKELYFLIEKHSFDEMLNGYTEALAEDWSMLDDVRLSDKDMNEKKTMNTHLHVLEAYTNLYRIWPSSDLAESLEKLIRLFLDTFINANKHLNLFFDNDWNLKSKTISFGHDIECSWLLHEAALVLHHKKLIERTKANAVAMTDVLLAEGVDADGAIFNEFDPVKDHLDTDKDWWPQAEGLVGLYNVYQITQDTKYLDALFKLFAFVREKVLDHVHGEWYWKLNREGVPYKEEKTGPWKCPYHNTRACIELMERIK